MPLLVHDATSHINSTATLVAAYNTSEVDEERDVLFSRLEKYAEWFEEHMHRHLQDGMLEEYAQLAGIMLRGNRDRKLLMRVLSSLGERAYQKRHTEPAVILAIAQFLQTVDENVFSGASADLLDLTDDLLAKLNPRKNDFSKGNHNTHCAILFALHQTMLALQRISPHELDPNDEGGVYCQFKDKLQKILQRSMYYPTRFQALIVEENLRRLASDAPGIASARTGRRLLSGLSGFGYVCRAVRAVLVADIDPEAIEMAYQLLKAACSSNSIQNSSWFECLSHLNEAVLVSVQDEEKLDALTKCTESILAALRQMRDLQDQKALLYGMICQLRVLALEGETSELRRSASQELMYVGTQCVACEGWDKESDIIETLLQALRDVHLKGENRELTEPALIMLHSRDNPVCKVGLPSSSPKDFAHLLFCLKGPRGRIAGWLHA